MATRYDSLGSKVSQLREWCKENFCMWRIEETEHIRVEVIKRGMITRGPEVMAWEKGTDLLAVLDTVLDQLKAIKKK